MNTQTERLRWLHYQLDLVHRLIITEARDPSEDGGRLLALLDQLEAKYKDAIAVLLTTN